jgi:hypothetical protein
LPYLPFGTITRTWAEDRTTLASDPSAGAKERLDFFWSQGIRGADFFISAIGPALSVFGCPSENLKTTHTGTIDLESN